MLSCNRWCRKTEINKKVKQDWQTLQRRNRQRKHRILCRTSETLNAGKKVPQSRSSPPAKQRSGDGNGDVPNPQKVGWVNPHCSQTKCAECGWTQTQLVRLVAHEQPGGEGGRNAWERRWVIWSYQSLLEGRVSGQGLQLDHYIKCDISDWNHWKSCKCIDSK